MDRRAHDLVTRAVLAALAATALTGAPPAEAKVPAIHRSVDSGRVRQNFNAGWRFHLGDADGAEKAEFNDGGWQNVGLPHSFSTPYFQAPEVYVGYGWYRKDLMLKDVPPGRRVSLEFEGAFQTADVYVNGIKVGRHRGGYTGFPVDLTPALHPGRNVIAVRVDNIWDPTLAQRYSRRR